MSESNFIGSWTLIGYVAPGATNSSSADNTNGSTTTNFKYTPASDLTGATGTAAIAEATSKTGWTATNRVALNECKKDAANWTVPVNGNANGNSVAYHAAMPNCAANLTATFNNIGK